MNNPLLDNEFLEELMSYRQREIYARITLLTQDELPVEYIEGRVTGGSISVDGSSALRRTCNLTMILKNSDEVNQFNWTFKSKFKLEIGIKNMINRKYPDIIWFKQGVFILTTCNMSQTTNNYTITINGKDKMCLLNGDIGGTIPHSTDFGVEEYLDKNTGDIIYNKVLLKDIIWNSVQMFGGELAENIIINDLDEAGLELLEYRYEDPLYLFRDIATEYVTQVTLDKEHEVILENGFKTTVGDESKIIYMKTSDLVNQGNPTPTIITLNNDENNSYNIIKLEYGDLSGYRLTDLVYAGDLISNIGESLTSVLDKIKNMLGNFEYFYNLDGKFVFQKKRTYVSTPWGATEQNQEDLVNTAINDSFPKINLMNAQLVTAFANNPNLLNVKNDFSVWGTYKSISGADMPIHMRYALDIKPTKYQPIRSIWTRRENTIESPPSDYLRYENYLENREYEDSVLGKMISSYFTVPFITEGNPSENDMVVDWREIIYQMALDYYASGNEEDFRFQVAAANPEYPLGKTGYEQYYIDLQGFWRGLYDPDPEDYYDEIGADTANSIINDNNLKDNLYVQNYYKFIPNDKLKDEKGNLLYKPEDFYIIQKITVKDINGNESKKDTFYPFIGSQYCCLEKDKTYWYFKDSEYVEENNPDILNLLSLSQIYYGTRDIQPVIQVSLNNFIESDDFKNGKIKLWIKENERTKFNDLDSDCQKIYRGGKNNSGLVQYLYNWKVVDNYGNLSTDQEIQEKITYIQLLTNADYNRSYWNKSINESPSSLIFWFDFLDVENSDLYKYSVKQIGPRTKSINDSNVKSIYYRDVPNIIFVQDLADKKYARQPGYTYIQLPIDFQSLFSISGRGKSAKERIDELLQEHSYAIEQTNITTVPLYHLEPNTRVIVQDKMSNIDGEYIVSKISIPLAYNGTMTLTTNKVVSNIM